MTSAGVIGAAVGCGCALLFIIGFIIFRYKVKRNDSGCLGIFSSHKHEFGSACGIANTVKRSPTASSAWSLSGSSNGASSKVGLAPPKISPVQPDSPSCTSSGVISDGLYPSQTLYPLDYHRKLSSSTGYSSHSNDTCRGSTELQPTSVRVHYRIYYDLDNAQLILHLLEVKFTASSTLSEGESTSPERRKQLPYRDAYISFFLSSSEGERRCGQTKIARINSSTMTGNYDEIFALPANFETIMEQRVHFDVLYYNNYSRPQSLGNADVALDVSSLDNQDMWTEMNLIGSSPSPTADFALRETTGPRPEVLVFLSYYIPRDELHVDILKAKNISGLFPVYSQTETVTEIYVKTCLIVDGGKIKKRSTSQQFSHITNATCVWNESLSYPVTYSKLELCVLLLYIVQRSKEAKKEKTVGKCVIGPFGGSSNPGYLQWQQQGNAQIIRSNAVWHPIVRYGGGN